MTLKYNKTEPVLIQEPVASIRTALSDLYLEQLLQNKPKVDKVSFLSGFRRVCFRFSWLARVLPGSRYHKTGYKIVRNPRI